MCGSKGTYRSGGDQTMLLKWVTIYEEHSRIPSNRVGGRVEPTDLSKYQIYNAK